MECLRASWYKLVKKNVMERTITRYKINTPFTVEAVNSNFCGRAEAVCSSALAGKGRTDGGLFLKILKIYIRIKVLQVVTGRTKRSRPMCRGHKQLLLPYHYMVPPGFVHSPWGHWIQA